MKCKKCGREAVINMQQHKLALCEECFSEWVPERVRRTIEKHEMFSREDRILVAVSGGKDSLALWDILQHLGYEVRALHIELGIEREGYSAKSMEKVQAFAEQRGGLPFEVVDVKAEYGKSVPELARERRRRRTCSLCGLVKRYIMNRAAYSGGYSVIATGHNLDDEAAALFQNVLHWQVGYLTRQAPVLPSTHPKLARKAKPLCLLYEREMAAYALVKGIDYIYDECPYSVGAKTLYYKQILNQLEGNSRGAKQQFYASFVRARRKHELFRRQAQELQLNECERCGQPTTAPGLCAFCRLWEDGA